MSSVKKSLLTLEEQKKILLVAKGLIKEPENWVRGQWKCPAIKTRRDDKGRFTPGKQGLAKDANGNQLYNYCIEGAINEATARVLGPERMDELGIHPEGNPGRLLFRKRSGSISTPTRELGLDEVARELYGIEAMQYNDSSNSTHEGVLGIIQTGLRRVTSRLKTPTRKGKNT